MNVTCNQLSILYIEQMSDVPSFLLLVKIVAHKFQSFKLQ